MTTTPRVMAELRRAATKDIVRLVVNARAAQQKVAPVDTGFFKNNWGVKLNHYDFNTVKRDPSAVGARGAQRTAETAEALAGFRAGRNWKLYLFNNAEYTETINDRKGLFIETALAAVVAAENRSPKRVIRTGIR